MEFLNSLKKRSKHYSTPFNHWELSEPLTKEAIKEICRTEITDLSKININYDGTRAIDGGEGKFREGISGGGLVKVKATAKGEIKAIEIDKSIMNAEEKDITEDLIVAAINDARQKGEVASQEKMKSITGGLPLPPGMKLPF